MTSTTQERRQAVLAALVRAGAAGMSGEQLARALACSRAAVHRHVEALRREGIGISGVHEGYVLAPDADPVVPALISPLLTPPINGPVRWSASTGSTNDDVAAAARAGAPEGLVLGADVQTAGRGRRGRPWTSGPHDSLTFSVLLRPAVAPIDGALLPLVVAVAVAETFAPHAQIIWPNDIVVDGRKVCGILCESSLDEGGIAWAVVGIGVNVHAAPPLDGSRWQAGAIGELLGMNRPQLLAAILASLARRYREWVENGPDGIVARYREMDGLAGRQVSVETADGDLTATAEGIDTLGRLVVRTGDTTRALGSGEVMRVR